MAFSFESALLLIALQRYPHALIACVSAIESAIKARPGCGRRRGTLKILFEEAQKDCPELATFPPASLDSLRELRNHTVHNGFVSTDDESAAAELVLTGLPFLAATYQTAFGFSLSDSLIPPFGAHLDQAIAVFGKSNSNERVAIAALSALGHLTRWSFRHSLMAPWERLAVDPSESYDLELDIGIRLRAHARRELDPACELCCPVCETPETLICKLDDKVLEQRRVELAACFCVTCGLQLSSAARSLLNALCAEEVGQAEEEILNAFGL